MDAGFDVDGVTGEALRRSNLREVPAGALGPLLAGAIRRRIEPGAIVEVAGESRAHVHLVLSGLIRMSVHAADGRTMTVRYCRAGSLIGVASLFAPEFELPVSIEAVTSAELLDLRPHTVARSVDASPAVRRALLVEMGERVQSFVEEIPRATFASVSERVARHLLDLASPESDGTLVVEIGQEGLAAAVGSVREVAARALRGLRDQGLVRTERGRIAIVDPDGLVEAAGS